jgi:sec-independent protein translocase protein TatA
MGLGLPELLVILCIFMLVFGANRLPEIGRGLGKGIRSFKDATRQGIRDGEPTEKTLDPQGVSAGRGEHAKG